jgi:hypothetical protein
LGINIVRQEVQKRESSGVVSSFMGDRLMLDALNDGVELEGLSKERHGSGWQRLANDLTLHERAGKKG